MDAAEQNANNGPINDVLREVVDKLLEGFLIIDTDWRFVYVNEIVIKQAKRTKEELLGHTMMECFPGVENTLIYATIKKSIQEGTDVRVENEFPFPDGRKEWFLAHVHPYKSGAVILSVNITERKKMEAALKEKINALELLTNVTVNRETQMVVLKEEIKNLKMLAGKSFQ